MGFNKDQTSSAVPDAIRILEYVSEVLRVDRTCLKGLYGYFNTLYREHYRV